MNAMMKRLFGILLSLTLILGLMPGMTTTALADDPIPSNRSNEGTSVDGYADLCRGVISLRHIFLPGFRRSISASPAGCPDR